MKILDFFRPRKLASASVAKERLQIIVSHESARSKNPEFIKKLQDELLAVICKYVNIDPEKVRVQLERTGDHSVLELNVTLPDATELLLTAPSAQAKAAEKETEEA